MVVTHYAPYQDCHRPGTEGINLSQPNLALDLEFLLGIRKCRLSIKEEKIKTTHLNEVIKKATPQRLPALMTRLAT